MSFVLHNHRVGKAKLGAGLAGGLGLAMAMQVALAADPGSLDFGQVKKAVDKAANWLIGAHNLTGVRGTFGKGKAAAMPGVAALAIKGLAECHRKYTEDIGPFMSEPVKFLLVHQVENGAFVAEGFGRESYQTSLAVMALLSLRKAQYDPQVAKGKEYLLRCQGPHGEFFYEAGRGQGGGLSAMVFSVQALLEAGVPKDSEAFRKALDFARRCQDLPETNPELKGVAAPGGGGMYYRPGQSEVGSEKGPGGKEFPKCYGSMTAAGLEVFLRCGLTVEAPEVQGVLRWLRKNFSAVENPGAGKKGYFYYLFALTRALTLTGTDELAVEQGPPIRWPHEIAKALLKVQAPDGSFVNTEPPWMENEPVLCTAFALHALNLCLARMK